MHRKSPSSLARALRNDIFTVSGGSHDRLVQIAELGLRHPIFPIPVLEAALSIAIERGWLSGEGNPVKAVRLTETGRRLSAARWNRP